MLVKQYGVPEYGEVDPTPLFAVTFVLMFGSMFGDIGQGAVIALAAWLLRKKLGRFWPFGLMAGLSSMVFGVLFGSIFGEEHLIPALWMNPLSDPLLMLRIAWAGAWSSLTHRLPAGDLQPTGDPQLVGGRLRTSRHHQPDLLSGADQRRSERRDGRRGCPRGSGERRRRLRHIPMVWRSARSPPSPGTVGGISRQRSARRSWSSSSRHWRP
jgi:hypothetical protein